MTISNNDCRYLVQTHPGLSRDIFFYISSVLDTFLRFYKLFKYFNNVLTMFGAHGVKFGLEIQVEILNNLNIGNLICFCACEKCNRSNGKYVLQSCNNISRASFHIISCKSNGSEIFDCGIAVCI